MAGKPYYHSAPVEQAGVTALDFDGGLVLLDQARQRLLVHNEAAAALWAALVQVSPTR